MSDLFPLSYPYSEDSSQGKQYMNTRCPAWCDRILMSSSARDLVSKVSFILIITKLHKCHPSSFWMVLCEKGRKLDCASKHTWKLINQQGATWIVSDNHANLLRCSFCALRILIHLALGNVIC